MERYLAGGTILLHWSVNDELHKKDDEIAGWFDSLIKNGGLSLIPCPKEMPESYIEVCAWPTRCVRPHAQPYTPTAINEFHETTRADAWLCAQALESGYSLVSREKPEPMAYHKVKIPDVCEGLGITCLTFTGFFDAIDLVV